MRCYKVSSVGVLAIASLLCTGTLHAEKLGKLFIKAATADVGGQQFADKELEESVKDLQRRIGEFILAEDEADADFLMVVVKRQVELKGHGQQGNKRLYVTISVRDGTNWKPGAQLSNGGMLTGGSWGVAARDVIGAAQKWVKQNRGK